jgi:hypothetical protein
MIQTMSWQAAGMGKMIELAGNRETDPVTPQAPRRYYDSTLRQTLLHKRVLGFCESIKRILKVLYWCDTLWILKSRTALIYPAHRSPWQERVSPGVTDNTGSFKMLRWMDRPGYLQNEYSIHCA